MSEGFGEYKKLREQGYSKEEAAAISLGKISSEFLFSKADDYLLKNNKIDEVFYSKNGIVAKAEAILPESQKKSTIAERIEKDEISTKIDKWKQNKHIEGTKEYRDRYKDGSNPQDILTVSMEEAQKLVDKFGGKGDPGKSDINGTWTEFVDADYVVGKYYSNGEYHDTKRFTIHYGKKGAHVIPVRPKEEMKK